MSTRVASRNHWGALGRMGIVAGMHVAVAFVIAGALVIKNEMTLPPEIETTIIDEPPQPVDTLPIPEPRLQPMDLTVPPPEVPPFAQDTVDPPIMAQVLPPKPVVDPVGSAEPVPVIQDVRQDPRRPLTQPYYPPSEIRAGNEGNADLEVYVLPNGRIGDVRIIRSTGHPRLDQSAIDEAKKTWRLIPATRDGVAIAQWHRLRVVFQLKKD